MRARRRCAPACAPVSKPVRATPITSSTAAAAMSSIWRSAIAILEIPSFTRMRTSVERSPRTVNASSCIATAGPTDRVGFPENTVLLMRWRALRGTFHDLRRGHAHRYIDAHQGFHPDIGWLDPGGRDIDQCAPDRHRGRGDEDHMVPFAADQDRLGHRQ